MSEGTLTTTRKATYRRCPREHEYRYNLGYRGVVEAAALRFGRLFHLALEAWWRESGEARLAAAIGAIEREIDTDPFDAAKARALIVGYHARWADVRLDPVAVEARFSMPQINPETGAASRTWVEGGVVDAIARDEKMRLLLVEHKTTSEDASPGSDYWKRLRLDGQISAYYLGAEALGHRVEGCLYDVIVKPALRPYEATPTEARKYTKAGELYANQRACDETPAEYEARLVDAICAAPERFYVRGEVVRLEEEVREHAWDSWQIGRAIREAQLANRHPRNPDACVRYGRTCEFFAVCCGEAQLTDESLYRRGDPHPELADPREVGDVPASNAGAGQ